MSTSAVFPEIHQMAQVDGQVVRLRKLQNPFGAVIPAGEALNILEGSFFMRISVFTLPERASGDIFPITGCRLPRCPAQSLCRCRGSFPWQFSFCGSSVYEKRPVDKPACFSSTANRLIVAPTHGTYLDNGTGIGLTVDNLTIAYTFAAVNIPVTLYIYL